MRTLARRIPDITAPFARFTGRQRLSPYDRAIIHALERQRLSGLTIRAHVVDRPGHDSTSLLTLYINWLLSLTPDSIIAIQDRNKRDARQVARQLHTLRHLRPLRAPAVAEPRLMDNLGKDLADTVSNALTRDISRRCVR